MSYLQQKIETFQEKNGVEVEEEEELKMSYLQQKIETFQEKNGVEVEEEAGEWKLWMNARTWKMEMSLERKVVEKVHLNARSL